MVTVREETSKKSEFQVNLQIMILFAAFCSIIILFLFFSSFAINEAFKLYLFDFDGYHSPGSSWNLYILNIVIQLYYPNTSHLLLSILLFTVAVILRKNPLKWHQKTTKFFQKLLVIQSIPLILAYVMSKIASVNSIANLMESALVFKFIVVALEMLAFLTAIIMIILLATRGFPKAFFSFKKLPIYLLITSMVLLISSGILVCVSQYLITVSMLYFRTIYTLGAILNQLALFLILCTVCICIISSIPKGEIKSHFRKAAEISTILLLLSDLLNRFFLLLYNLVESFPNPNSYSSLLVWDSILKNLRLASFIILVIMALTSQLQSKKFLLASNSNKSFATDLVSSSENSIGLDDSIPADEFFAEQRGDKKATDEQFKKIYLPILIILSVVFVSFMFDTEMFFSQYNSYFTYGIAATLFLAISLLLLGIVIIRRTNSHKALHIALSVFLFLTSGLSLIYFILSVTLGFFYSSVDFQMNYLYGLLLSPIFLFLVVSAIISIVLLKKQGNTTNFISPLILASIGFFLHIAMTGLILFLGTGLILFLGTGLILFLGDVISQIPFISSIEIFFFMIYLFLLLPQLLLFSSLIPLLRNKKSKNKSQKTFDIGIVVFYLVSKIASITLRNLIPPESVGVLSYVRVQTGVNFATSLPQINLILYFFIIFLVSMSLILKLYFRGTISSVYVSKDEAETVMDRVSKRRIRTLFGKMKKSYRSGKNFWMWKGIEFVIILAIILGSIFGIRNYYRANYQNALFIKQGGYDIRDGTAYDSFSVSNQFYNDMKYEVFIAISASEEVRLRINYPDDSYDQTFSGSLSIRFKDVFTSLRVDALSTSYTKVHIRIYNILLSGGQFFALYSPIFIGVAWITASVFQILHKKKKLAGTKIDK